MRSPEDRIARLAELLIAAHTSGKPASVPADLVPVSYAEATAVQATVIGELGAEVAAWKISIDNDGLPLPGPILASRLFSAERPPPAGQPLLGLLEVEVAARLKHDLPPRAAPYTRSEVIAAIDSLVAGIEIITPRLSEGTKAHPRAFLADNLGNGCYVVGTGTSHWQDLDIGALRCVIELDGQTVHDARGGHGQSDPLLPLARYASRQIDKLGGMKAGQFITTGSLHRPINLLGPVRVRATVQGIGSVGVG
jgi:2-keto-4-pentenoate hydratase